MKPMRFIVSSLMVLILSGLAYPSQAQDWEKKAFVELSKTPNAVTWTQWTQLQDFEKLALYETRYVKRVDARQAFFVSQIPEGIIISVDEAEYYARQRITPSLNVPSSRFTEAFVQKNLKFFNNFKYIMVYCR